MISFLLTEEAKNEATILHKTLMENKSVSFPPDPSLYPLSLLREGAMIGVMILETKGGERKLLYGFSGAMSGIYDIPGWVKPCFSLSLFHATFDPYDKEIHRLTDLIEKEGREDLKEERRKLSAEAQEKLNEIFVFSRWDGGKIQGLPPRPRTGTGECAGLKLINTALRKGWEIKGLAEFKWSKESAPTEFFPPCEERCGALMEEMLGLKYLYADQSIAVVDKRAGMLSVPGRGIEKRDSVSHRFHTLFPSTPEVCHVHRLDMDTSGLLVLAFDRESVKNLMMQFEERSVRKTYVALLEGVIEEESGDIDMPMRLDTDHRPRQIVDWEMGKRAITHWERIKVITTPEERFTLVRFFPHTGRTHQLRVHASEGLRHPIVGDNLYGHQKEGERLMLHAESIVFRHPKTNEEMEFISPCPFSSLH